MREELDKLLCEKYPKIFADRYKSMTETCMCWGFDCGDGWFNILNQLCGNIQHRIDWKRGQKARALRYNRALKKALTTGDKSSLIYFYTRGEREPSEWNLKNIEEDIERRNFRKVEEPPVQVVAEQVKEKFGTLRFYYRGGDEYIDGLVSMAEAMSGVTCETCGKPGETRSGGWIRTLCDEHEDEYQEKRNGK